MKDCQHYIEGVNLYCHQFENGICAVLWDREINRGRVRGFSLEYEQNLDHIAEQAEECGDPKIRNKIKSSAFAETAIRKSELKKWK